MGGATGIVLLAVLTIVGFYTIHIVGSANTLYDQIDALAGVRQLSQTDSSLKWPPWLESLNILVLPGTLAGFFWPCVEPANATIALIGILFAAQAVAGFTVVIVDGWRNGNLAKLVAL